MPDNHWFATSLLILFMFGAGGGDAAANDRTSLAEEVAKLTAGVVPSPGFGLSVSLSNRAALVGFIDDGGGGSVLVFERDQGATGTWRQVAKLQANDSAEFDLFGRSVSLDGDTALVGAVGDDDGGSRSGSAYVFERDQDGEGDWRQVAKLSANDAAPGDEFGISVSISGTTALVGAFRKDDPAIGEYSGAAYLFERNQGGNGAWGQVAKLQAEDTAIGDVFGISVSLDGNTALIGARDDDDYGNESGAAYVFEREAETWAQVAKLRAEDAAAYDAFGTSVSLSNNMALIGAPVDGNELNAVNTGSVYIFERGQGATPDWVQVAKLQADDTSKIDHFGYAVSLSGDRAIVGAWLADGYGVGLRDAGAAYIFERDHGGTGAWQQVVKLEASEAEEYDQFGFSVSLFRTTALVGTFPHIYFGSDLGKAYVFDFVLFADGFESGDQRAWSSP